MRTTHEHYQRYYMPEQQQQPEYTYSRFNIVVTETPDKVLLFNSYTSKLAWLPKVTDIPLPQGSNILLDIDNLDDLEEQGFIVPSSIDEIQRLKDNAQRALDQKDRLYLSIALTMACNYRCEYCFEKDHHNQASFMSRETADDIISFIQRMYDQHQFKYKLKIKWFGGEPLLNMDIIRYLSNRLKQENIPFDSVMFTNGRLLTKEIALELKELGLNGDVVIALDGLAPTHAKIRHCNEQDFYTILENIKAAENILKFHIHIHVVDATKQEAEPLYKLLREQYNIKSIIYPTRLSVENEASITSDTYISYEDFCVIQDRFSEQFYNLPVEITKHGPCEACERYQYVIGTQGELYYCERLLGRKDHIIGNIRTQLSPIDKSGSYFDFNRLVDDCLDCPLIPICTDTCSKKRYYDKLNCEREEQLAHVRKKVLRALKLDE